MDGILSGVLHALKSLVDTFAVSNRTVYQVVDYDKNYLSEIYLDKVKVLIFRNDRYHQLKIADIIDYKALYNEKNESMESAMKKFEYSTLWRIPVTYGRKYNRMSELNFLIFQPSIR